jgi:hypothetical protein
MVVDLIADGGSADTAFKVGEVEITDNLDGTITVAYINMTEPWVILETHVDVGVLKEDGTIVGIPMNKKSKNPKVGKFDYEDGDTITLPTGLDAGDKIIIAAHAEVQDPTDIVVEDDPETPEDETEYREESAWADGENFGVVEGVDTGNWSMYIVYYTELPPPPPPPAPGKSSTTASRWGAIKSK